MDGRCKWTRYFCMAVLLLFLIGGAVAAGPEELPESGFSAAPELTPDSYLAEEFFYTEENRTFYFVCTTEGAKIDQAGINVWIGGEVPQDLTWYVTESGNVIAFTIVDGAQLDNTVLVLSVTTKYEAETETRNYFLSLYEDSPRLWFGYPRRQNGQWIEDPEDCVLWSEMSGRPGLSESVILYYGTRGDYAPVSTEQVSIEKPGVVEVSRLGETDTEAVVWSVDYVGFGTTELTVTGDGWCGSLPVSVELPMEGFSTQSTLTEGSYLSDAFQYTETDRILYYVTRYPGEQFVDVSVTVEGGPTDLISCEVQEGGTAVQITISPQADFDNVRAEFDFLYRYDGDEQAYPFREYLRLMNGQTQLWGHQVGYGWDGWEEWPDDSDSGWVTVIDGPRNTLQDLVFYYGVRGSGNKLDPLYVEADDTGVVSVDRVGETADGISVWEISVLKYGTATLTVGGEEWKYTMPIRIELPMMDFSTQPVLTEETCLDLQPFYYTDSSRTFYYVNRAENGIFQNAAVTVGGQPSESITCEILPDGKVIQFTIAEDAAFEKEAWMQLRTECVYDGYTEPITSVIELAYNGDQLWYHDVWPNGDGTWYESEQEWRDTEIFGQPGVYLYFVLYYGNREEQQPLNNYEVSVENSGIATLEKMEGATEDGYPVWRLEGTGCGTTELVVTTGDKTYTMPVTVALPHAGFCAAPELTEESFLRDNEFQYTPAQPNFYYVISDPGATITQAEIYQRVYAADGAVSEVSVPFVTAEEGPNGTLRMTVEGEQLPSQWVTIWIRLSVQYEDGGNGTIEDGITLCWDGVRTVPQAIQDLLGEAGNTAYAVLYDAEDRILQIRQVTGSTVIFDRIADGRYYVFYCLDSGLAPLTECVRHII